MGGPLSSSKKEALLCPLTTSWTRARAHETSAVAINRLRPPHVLLGLRVKPDVATTDRNLAVAFVSAPGKAAAAAFTRRYGLSARASARSLGFRILSVRFLGRRRSFDQPPDLFSDRNDRLPD
jgi:hypothetical protein